MPPNALGWRPQLQQEDAPAGPPHACPVPTPWWEGEGVGQGRRNPSIPLGPRCVEGQSGGWAHSRPLFATSSNMKKIFAALWGAISWGNVNTWRLGRKAPAPQMVLGSTGSPGSLSQGIWTTLGSQVGGLCVASHGGSLSEPHGVAVGMVGSGDGGQESGCHGASWWSGQRPSAPLPAAFSLLHKGLAVQLEVRGAAPASSPLKTWGLCFLDLSPSVPPSHLCAGNPGSPWSQLQAGC